MVCPYALHPVTKFGVNKRSNRVEDYEPRQYGVGRFPPTFVRHSIKVGEEQGNKYPMVDT